MRSIKYVIIVILTVVLTDFSLFSQDIIVTKKGTKIEVKILEIGLETVKYKEYSYLNGPDYVIKKSEIASILYENGKAVVFEEYLQPVQQPQQTQQPQPMPSSNSQSYEQPNLPIRNYAGYPLYREGNNYYLDGTTKRLNSSEYEKFLQYNCSRAYNTYQKGHRMYVTGVVLSIVGSSTACIGTFFFIADAFWGLVITAPGIALGCGVGIPLLIAGKKKMNYQSMEEYNRTCSIQRRASANFSLNVSPNKLSLNLNF